MRLVDADALENLCDIMADKCDGIEASIWNQFRATVEWQPTIDAVPVVRCKDCKYMTEHCYTDGNAPYWTCSEWDAGTDYDGFCHYGERKEDE